MSTSVEQRQQLKDERLAAEDARARRWELGSELEQLIEASRGRAFVELAGMSAQEQERMWAEWREARALEQDYR